MREITMYCSARDQEVRVVVTDDPTYDGQASLLDSEIVCLEIGDRCSGGMCPIDAQPAAVMDLRLAKSGLRPEHRTHVRTHCEGCDRETDMLLTVGGYATCEECGTTQRLVPWH